MRRSRALQHAKKNSTGPTFCKHSKLGYTSFSARLRISIRTPPRCPVLECRHEKAKPDSALFMTRRRPARVNLRESASLPVPTMADSGYRRRPNSSQSTRMRSRIPAASIRGMACPPFRARVKDGELDGERAGARSPPVPGRAAAQASLSCATLPSRRSPCADASSPGWR